MGWREHSLAHRTKGKSVIGRRAPGEWRMNQTPLDWRVTWIILPLFIREKNWDPITSKRYYERTALIISAWIFENRSLPFMKNGAPSHSSTRTWTELNQIRIYPTTWPAHTLDSSPIENLWIRMKDLIEYKYPGPPDRRERSSDRLRKIVRRAWRFIRLEELTGLLTSLLRRWLSFTDTDGRKTKI